MYSIRITLILTYLLILIGCTDNNNKGTPPVLTPPDIPVAEYHWQFIRLEWVHPTHTVTGVLPIGELKGYYVLFTDLDTLSMIDFETGVTQTFVVSLPPARYRVEIYTLDINNLISDPIITSIAKESFRYYGGYTIKCVEPEGVGAYLNPSTDSSGVGYYFNCEIT